MPTFHAPLDRLAFSLSRCPKIRDRRTPPSVLASPPPPKRGDGSRHYLPLSSEARADQGCRKRRNQVPDWSEIRCRFPPKSPAAFDRNQVPVCSDFCTVTQQFNTTSSMGRLTLNVAQNFDFIKFIFHPTRYRQPVASLDGSRVE